LNSYTFHITLYDPVFFGMIFIGLTFALLLAFAGTVNRGANRLLALALVTMTLWMIRILAIDISLNTYLPHWDWLPTQFLLALGPLIYFYVLKITCPQYKFSWRDLLHFSPLLLEQGIFALEISESTRTDAAVYATQAFQQLNPVLQLLIFTSVITYLYKSHKVIQNFYRRLQPVLMDRSLLEFRWLRRLLAATALLWLLWICCAAVDYFGYGNQLGIHVYYPFYIFFAVITVWTAAAAFLRPQAGVTAQTPPSFKPTLSTELREKGARLRRSVEANGYYQDPELSLSSLAEKLGLHPHELSRIINMALKKNFNDFINEYRIRDVISKMQDPAYNHMTLLGIAFEAGFNSQSTFSRIFKQLTGKSPAEFKNSLKKEYPSYNLRSQARFASVISYQQTTPMWAEVKLTSRYMFKNYLKIAWRNIIRNKTFAFINIFGLALGLACSLLIFLWVQDERSINASLVRNKDTYDVYERVYSEGKVEAAPSTPGLLAAELKRNIPDIKYASGFWSAQAIRFSAGEKNIIEKGCFADSDYFKIFNYAFLEGTPETALRLPEDIALSRKMATAFFGSPAAAIGKTIRYNGLADFRVSAVFEDLAANTSEKFDYALNWQFLLRYVGWLTNWINRSPATFVQLQPNTGSAKVELAIKGFIQPYLGTGYGAGFRTELGLQPFDEMYLHSAFKNGVPDGGRIEYVRLFSLIAVFILLIACINFMNLATARSAKRAKEVGIRKTVGAAREWLILQFIGEAILLALLAFLVAVIMLVLVLPVFNEMTGKQIALPVMSGRFWAAAASLALITGLVAGSYPALYLSSLVPLKVLKSTLKFSQGALILRKGLVAFQFVLSIVFIVATIVVTKQVRYLQGKNLGFNKENLVYIPMERGLALQYPLLKQQLTALPGIAAVTYSNQVPTQIGSHVYDLSWEGKDPAARVVAMHNGVGYDYLKTMHLTLLMGRDFSKDFPTDTVGYIINESAWKLTGYKEPIGKPLIYFGHRGKIIGVARDFHFQSLHDPIQPLVLEFMGERITWDGAYAIIKIAPGNTREAIAGMERVCKRLDPAFPFRYSFADEEYQNLYNSERTVSKLSDSFALLAIFISCLGLLGLAMFTAEQRRKEIGIRKVIGAGAGDIIMMLSKDILQLVALSAVIATPIAWLATHNWLQGFAYRTSVDWWIFLLAGLIAMLIALVTVGYQAVKASLANPVKSLRTE